MLCVLFVSLLSLHGMRVQRERDTLTVNVEIDIMADSNVDNIAKYAYSDRNKQQTNYKPFNKALDKLCKKIKVVKDTKDDR